MTCQTCGGMLRECACVSVRAGSMTCFACGQGEPLPIHGKTRPVPHSADECVRVLLIERDKLRAENEALQHKFDHLYRRACQVMPFGHEPNGRDDIPFALMLPAREIVLTPIRPMVELRDELVEIARLDAQQKEPK